MSERALDPAQQAQVMVPFVIVTLVWSSTWLVIRDQIGWVPASWSICYRFLIAGIGMAAYATASRQSLRLPREGVSVALALGLFQFVFNYVFVYAAEAYITSGLVAVVFALLIVPNAVLARIFLGQGISSRFCAGSGVAIVGVALLFVQEWEGAATRGGSVMLGIVLALVATLAASIANIIQATERMRRLSTVAVLSWGMLSGSAMNAIYAFATVGPPAMDWRWGYLAGLLYLGLIGSTIAFLLYVRVIQTIGPARAAYSSVLTPVIAMALSTIFEGYRWTWLAVAGGVLVLSGLMVAMRSRRPAR